MEVVLDLLTSALYYHLESTMISTMCMLVWLTRYDALLHRRPMPGAEGRHHTSSMPQHHELRLHAHGGIRDVRGRCADWDEEVSRFRALGEQQGDGHLVHARIGDVAATLEGHVGLLVVGAWRGLGIACVALLAV